jgi:RNA polymerase sigma factor (sigma-70 family)
MVRIAVPGPWIESNVTFKFVLKNFLSPSGSERPLSNGRMSEDRELIDAFVRDGSEEAFAILTRRHLDLVYSAALRQVRDAELARDVAQAVFLLLARKARSFSPETVLAGWLYRTARLVSLEALRAERRRKTREEKMAVAVDQAVSPQETDEFWGQISPHLDGAMEHLKESDRNAIVLRFFNNRSLGEVAVNLGISEEAAKKRVSRALDKLRILLARQGITGSSSLLSATLAASAVQPTPALVASMILPLAAGQGMVAAGTAQLLTEGAIHMIAITKVQAASACVAVLLMVGGTGVVTIRHAGAAQEHARLVREQQSSGQSSGAVEQAAQLLAAAREENRLLREQTRELHQLRGEVTQLGARVRSDSTLPSSLRGAPHALKQAAETLRELQFEQFLAAGQKAITLQPLSDEERIEYIPEIDFMKNLGLALRIYASNHNDEFPATIDALLESNLLNPAMVERLQSGSYEYLRFERAESKPGLPAVWWRAPDARGIRVLVLNDGSSHLIREPAGVEKPGHIALTSSQNN